MSSSNDSIDTILNSMESGNAVQFTSVHGNRISVKFDNGNEEFYAVSDTVPVYEVVRHICESRPMLDAKIREIRVDECNILKCDEEKQ